MSIMDILTIILGALLALALTAIVVIAARTSSLRGRIETLSAEKAALEAKLAAQAEAQKQLEEQRAASVKEQRELLETLRTQDKEQAAKSLEEMRNALELTAEGLAIIDKEDVSALNPIFGGGKQK